MKHTVSPFIDLSEQTQFAIEAKAATFQASKGTLLQRADEPWLTVYQLEKGTVRMFYADRDGNEHNKRFFLPGDFFWPVTHALQTQPTGFMMEVISNAAGKCWKFDSFRGAFADANEWLAFSHIWMERLMEAKLARERDWLQLSAGERYRRLCRQQPELIKLVPAHHIASYLGITPVSLSRLKKSLHVNI